MKPFALGQKSWDKAHVTKRLDERSYEVQSAGTTFRRNRQHLVKTRQPTQFEQPVRDQATPNEIHDQQTSSNTRTCVAQLRPSPHRSLAGQKNVIPPLASHPQGDKSPPHSLMQTRSGCIIKAPAKFKDYIMSSTVLSRHFFFLVAVNHFVPPISATLPLRISRCLVSSLPCYSFVFFLKKKKKKKKKGRM